MIDIDQKEGHQVQCTQCGLMTVAHWAAQVDERLASMAEIEQGLAPKEQREAIKEPWAEYLQFLKVSTCTCHEPCQQMAHEYALEFLRPLVARGASIEKVSQYPSAHRCGPWYVVQVGGKVYYDGRAHSIKPRQLAVKELAGRPCLYVFELRALFAEMDVALHQMPLRQLSWLEGLL